MKDAKAPTPQGPRSFCECGHTGDGPASQHEDDYGPHSPGHGKCIVPDCPCPKFTWDRFIVKRGAK